MPENRNIGTIRKRKIVTKVLSFSTLAETAAIGIENAAPVSTATGTKNGPSHDETAPRGRDDRGVRGRRREDARDDEELVADEGVPLGQRRRDHPVVDARPLDRRHHRPAGLGRGCLHRRGGQGARRDEVEVRDAAGRVLGLVDDRAEADPERGQVEDRVNEARADRAAPDALVLGEPVLVYARSGCGIPSTTRSASGP